MNWPIWFRFERVGTPMIWNMDARRSITSWILLPLVLIALLVCIPATAWAASDGALTASTVEQQSVNQKAAFTKQNINMRVPSVKGQTIQAGNYIICYANDAQKLLTAPNNANNAAVRLAAQAGVKYQVWNFRYDSGSKAYVITNQASNKVLTISGSKVLQTKLIKGTGKGWKKQLWTIKSTTTGYMITSVSNPQYSVYITANGIVRVAKNSGSMNMRFWICKATRWNPAYIIKNGVYTLRSAAGPYLVQPEGNRLPSGTPFELAAKKNESLTQMYEIRIMKPGLYRIVNVGTDKALTARGSKIVEQLYNGDTRQLWRAYLNDDGSIMFKNEKFGWVLGLSSATAKAGVDLAITPKATSKAQKWYLSPTTTGLTLTHLKALQKVSKKKSATDTSLALDLTHHELMVFTHNKEKNTAWTLDDSWKISCGANKSTEEWVGNKSQWRRYNPPSKGSTCYYWSRMGHQQYMHSIIYRPGTYTVMDGSLGRSNTNGCVRMSLEHAKYVYFQIPEGTRVQRYY